MEQVSEKEPRTENQGRGSEVGDRGSGIGELSPRSTDQEQPFSPSASLRLCGTKPLCLCGADPSTKHQEWPSLSKADLSRTKPDVHMQLVDDHGCIQARCSLWWRNVPSYPAQTLGLIGHYAANSDSAAARLLDRALRHLAAQGCTMAVGPIDGSTWERYRFVIERGTEPRFFLEPDQPDCWVEQFRAHGFTMLASYYSTICYDLTQRSERTATLRKQLRTRGIRLRPFNSSNPTSDLRAIYQLSTRSFQQSFLYSPISEAAFLQSYQAIVPYIIPELLIMAEHADQLVGYLFSLPNHEQARRGEQIDTLIIKTLAIAPERMYAGLGSVLSEEVQLVAYDLGYRRSIHALMHEGNRSRTLSQRFKADPVRRYALFARELSR